MAAWSAVGVAGICVSFWRSWCRGARKSRMWPPRTLDFAAPRPARGAHAWISSLISSVAPKFAAPPAAARRKITHTAAGRKPSGPSAPKVGRAHMDHQISGAQRAPIRPLAGTNGGRGGLARPGWPWPAGRQSAARGFQAWLVPWGAKFAHAASRGARFCRAEAYPGCLCAKIEHGLPCRPEICRAASPGPPQNRALPCTSSRSRHPRSRPTCRQGTPGLAAWT